MGELQTLVHEFNMQQTHRDPTKAREKAKLLLQKLRCYPKDDKDAYREEPRMVRGLALYYLQEIFDLAFLADAVGGAETDPDDKVNEALLEDVRPKWLRIKPAYRIKSPFCDDRYTHKFVDEWYAEGRYSIGTYGSIVVQLPKEDAQNCQPSSLWQRIVVKPLQRTIAFLLSRGALTDLAVLLILSIPFWLLLWVDYPRLWLLYPVLVLVALGVGPLLCIPNGAHRVKALVPRLAACAVVGLAPPLMTKDVWNFSFYLWKNQPLFWILVGSLFFVSWLYLFIETHNHVGKGGLSVWRSLHILLRLCNFALFFSWWATGFISKIAPSLVKGKTTDVAEVGVRSLQVSVPIPTCLLFAVFAVFIGIFLQILWDDRPITSRL